MTQAEKFQSELLAIKTIPSSFHYFSTNITLNVGLNKLTVHIYIKAHYTFIC